MKILMILIFPLLLSAQEDALAILKKLQEIKSTPKKQELYYSPFKKPTILDNTAENLQNSDIKQDEKKNQTLSLKAIFNNKAFINTSWYKVDDKVGNFDVKKITKDSVILSRGNQQKTIRFAKYEQYLKVRKKEQ